MAQEDRKIVSFWNWFEDNKENLKPDEINRELINILNDKILDFGDLSWEIREGTQKENMFIISPGGNFKLLSKSRQIISMSPVLLDWEFYHYKPAKNWDYKLSIYEDSEIKIIDVSLWEYVLYKFKDNTFDIILKAKNIKSLSDDEKYTLADIVLESILGEEESLTLIKNIEFVKDFNIGDNSKKSSIRLFKNHIEHLMNIDL